MNCCVNTLICWLAGCQKQLCAIKAIYTAAFEAVSLLNVSYKLTFVVINFYRNSFFDVGSFYHTVVYFFDYGTLLYIMYSKTCP